MVLTACCPGTMRHLPGAAADQHDTNTRHIPLPPELWWCEWHCLWSALPSPSSEPPHTGRQSAVAQDAMMCLWTVQTGGTSPVGRRGLRFCWSPEQHTA